MKYDQATVNAIIDWLTESTLCPPEDKSLLAYCDEERCRECWVATLSKVLGLSDGGDKR